MKEESVKKTIEDQELLIARDAALIAYKIRDKNDPIYINSMDDLSKRLSGGRVHIVEFDKYYDMDKKITAGCIIETDDRIYVAFKGTTPANYEEVYNDAKASLSEVHFGHQTGEQKYIMHEGFYIEYMNSRSFFRNVINEINEHSPNFEKQVVFCGHSLGGAMASIAALEFASEGHKNLTCVTFGTPKIFSTNTAIEFDKVVDCKRVIDVKDPARIYPALRNDYKHAGKAILTDRGHIIAGHIIPDTYDKLIPAETNPSLAQKGLETFRTRATNLAETAKLGTESLASEIESFTLDAQRSLKSMKKTLSKYVNFNSFSDKSPDSPITVTYSTSPNPNNKKRE